ncbi:hypothetical protein I3843_02G077200 [Carya illinoinensis]|nr:hypothetical protein I3760_02G091100 [Carya illinoinensis]KAG7991462.1 hypothetical protein I3843_02G077200 [Carya illinoinensis]
MTAPVTFVLASKAYPVGMVRATDVNGMDEAEFGFEPHVGLEFDSADDARELYSLYAKRMGFKIRTGQLYRSRTDGSVASRRFVCSKEGFQLNSRSGCPAFIRVQRRDTGKWVIDHFLKDHNHDLEHMDEKCPPFMQPKTPIVKNLMTDVAHKPKVKWLEEVEGGQPCTSGVIKRVKREGDGGRFQDEPRVGLEFNSANEAHEFYHAYAANKGFRIRIGQLFRSKLDGSITSRRFVCSKEGYQHPSRVGCGAYMRIKRQDSGRWVVDRLKKDHNHELGAQMETHKKSFNVSNKFIAEASDELENKNLVTMCNGNFVKRCRENCIGSDWYSMLFEYFQSKQAEDTGFFYAVEVNDGNCMSIFWADGRSRYSCSQFGDTIVLDTSYKNSVYLVPFATFVGVNHHRQPVLLACALIAEESKESYSWLFKTWLRAMSGRCPLSIIADHDTAIQQAILEVFPGTHHRFSSWQFKAKESDFLSLMDNGFKCEYENCVIQSQTSDEFDIAWNTLLNRYDLKENVWLTEMYKMRASWVPLFLRGTFFAGIPINESIDSFFGTLLNAQTPVSEFVSRYERGLERRREDERKEDFNSFNLQAFLQTKEPVEEQCRRLYTLTVFKIFQKELLQSYSYLGLKICEEGSASRYLVRRCGNEYEKNIVAFCASNLNVGCSCQMFEFEGVLCRHILRVFQILDVREIPPHFILHRWTRNAEYGIIRDVESGGTSQEFRNLMLWSLRETACKYIEAGAASIEKYKLAYEIMREGGRKLCWQR